MHVDRGRERFAAIRADRAPDGMDGCPRPVFTRMGRRVAPGIRNSVETACGICTVRPHGDDEDKANNPVIAFSDALLVNLGRPAINRPGYQAAPRQRG